MKKIKFLALTSALLFGLGSCYKAPPIYKLTFNNNTSDTYLIEINNKSDYLEGGYFLDYNLEEGTYNYKYTQQDGYLLYPTIKEGTVKLYTDIIITID